jgi:hypothetical protein
MNWTSLFALGLYGLVTIMIVVIVVGVLWAKYHR